MDTACSLFVTCIIFTWENIPCYEFPVVLPISCGYISDQRYTVCPGAWSKLWSSACLWFCNKNYIYTVTCQYRFCCCCCCCWFFVLFCFVFLFCLFVNVASIGHLYISAFFVWLPHVYNLKRHAIIKHQLLFALHRLTYILQHDQFCNSPYTLFASYQEKWWTEVPVRCMHAS